MPRIRAAPLLRIGVYACLGLCVNLLALGGQVRPAAAQGGTTTWVEIELGRFILLSPTPLEAELRLFAQQQGPAINAAYDMLAPLYGASPVLPINLRVYNSRFEFTNLNALTPPLAAAAYHTHLGSREIALIWPYPANFLTSEAGANAIRHELSGLMLSALSGGTMPAGLESGFNQYAEVPGPATERGVARLQEAYDGRMGRPLLPWRELFDSDAIYTDDLVAYPQALSIAAFLIDNYGFASMRALALAMGTGQSYASALAAVYGQPLDRLEQAWLAYLPTYLAGRWQANVLYNFDLEPYRLGLEAGAYAQVGQALAGVTPLLEATGQTEKLAEAQTLLVWAAEGVAAEDLVQSQREALLNGDYALVLALGEAAQAAFGALGDSRRVHEIQDHLQRAQAVLDLRAALAEAQTQGAAGGYAAAEAQLLSLIPQFEALGDTAGSQAARAALIALANTEQAATAGRLEQGQRVVWAAGAAALLIGVQGLLLVVRARRRRAPEIL